MRIIISPAKKMRVDTDSLPIQALPSFLDRTELLLEAMRSMDAAKLQSLWKCNEKIAALNLQRLRDMDLRHGLTPAILSYEGIQYQYMAPGVFTGDEFDYIQEHLRIVSGFYGLLRPFDGVTPYRLEMQTKLAVDGARDLYAFWGDRLANALCSETNCILNLASKEYYLSIQRHLMPSVRFITCVFGELKGSNVVEKGTLCKMARGEMVRFLAQYHIVSPDELRSFDRLGFRYAPAYSSAQRLVFLREEHLIATPS